MSELFKDRVNEQTVAWLAQQVQQAWPAFECQRFVQHAVGPLPSLELKARVAHVSDALQHALPDDWTRTLPILLNALPPARQTDENIGKDYRLWPMLHLVQTAGLSDPERSVRALCEMTQRFTAEFAIRPYLTEHPELTWTLLERWTAHDSLHVRRWLSEGTRPRLPWGVRLRDSIHDPQRGLALIEPLIDDPEPYVRRSVANHLNDVSKDHPELTVQTARRWLDEQPHRQRLVRHSLRTLLKQGHAGALETLGYPKPAATLTALQVQPNPLRLGGEARMEATLEAHSTQEWMVDWVVCAPRANHTLSRRVLKGCRRKVGRGDRITVRQKLSLRPVTTRTYRAGAWRIGVQVNGQVLDTCALTVISA